MDTSRNILEFLHYHPNVSRQEIAEGGWLFYSRKVVFLQRLLNETTNDLSAIPGAMAQGRLLQHLSGSGGLPTFRPWQPRPLGQEGVFGALAAGLVRLCRQASGGGVFAPHRAKDLRAFLYQPTFGFVLLRHHPRGGDENHLRKHQQDSTYTLPYLPHESRDA